MLTCDLFAIANRVLIWNEEDSTFGLSKISLCFYESVCLFCSLHDFLPKEYVKVKGIEKKIFMVSSLPHYYISFGLVLLKVNIGVGSLCSATFFSYCWLQKVAGRLFYRKLTSICFQLQFRPMQAPGL